MVLENRSYSQVIGSPKAPYINSLARRYALATKYYAIGYPSLPNYVAMTGGAKNGIGTNCKQCDTEQPNLVNQLDAHEVDWRAYFEGLPKGDRLTSRTVRYNPFGYYERVSDPGQRQGRRKGRIWRRAGGVDRCGRRGAAWCPHGCSGQPLRAAAHDRSRRRPARPAQRRQSRHQPMTPPQLISPAAASPSTSEPSRTR